MVLDLLMYMCTCTAHVVCPPPPLQMLMPKIVVMYVIGVTGGTFYVSRFPESFFPGEYMRSPQEVMSNFTTATVINLDSPKQWQGHGPTGPTGCASLV